MLSDDEKRYLLTAARGAIDSALADRPVASRVVPYPELLHPSGAFVTLRERDELRGCVGYIDPVKPLLQTVEEAAVRAAFQDPRFEPLEHAELDLIEIEISVLSPLQRIASPSEIEVGTHGVVVQSRSTRGLLLPQVAVEYGWDRDTFLEQ